MWFSYFDDPGNFIALSIERVNEIIALNKEGEKPEDISVKREMPKVKLPDFENVVGQDSLTRFDNAKKKKKKKKKKPSGGLPNTNAVQTEPREKPAVQQNVPRQANEPKQQVVKENKEPNNQQNNQQKRPNRNNNNRNRNNNNRPPKPQAEG